jgi:hypothetical protein
MEDINSYSKSGIFFSKINTKNVYPPISNQFNEKTIYLAFIYFCKFKSLVPIPQDLIPICTGKPTVSLINQNDSVERIIQKLKDDGRNYTIDQFLRLLQIISRHNIVNINLDKPEISSITRLLELLDSMDDENDEVVEPALRSLIRSTLDTFDIASKECTKEIKELNNYLIRGIETMKEEIIDFIQKNAGSSITRRSISKCISFINSLSSWSVDDSSRNEDIKISNEKMFNIINFYRSFTDYFINVFPNIILNKVDHNNIYIPPYLGFSSNHSNKLKKYYKDYYEKLHTFYGQPTLLNVLNRIQTSALNLFNLSKETPSFSCIKIGEDILKPVFDERTSRFLYEFYLLRVIMNYIELSDEEEMVVTEVAKPQELTDLFSVEYLDEQSTHIDLSMASRTVSDIQLLSGNKKALRQSITHLLISFIEIMGKQKDTVNTSYEEIQDRVFKLKEREKDLITDRLKRLTDEERNADTILKINKLEQYSKGLQKGLTILDKDFYDEEQQFRDEMGKAEKIIRQKNKNASDEEVEQMLEDYQEEQEVNREIDDDVYSLDNLNEDFHNGNNDGVGGVGEEDFEDYQDYDS